MKTYTKKQIREYIKNHDSKWWFHEIMNGEILYYNSHIYGSLEIAIEKYDYGLCDFRRFGLWFEEDLDEYFQLKEHN